MKKTICLLLILTTCFTRNYAQDLLLNILKKEADRNLSVLKKQEVPAYYISYRVYDTETYEINTSLGSLMNSNPDKRRLFQAFVRVGNHELDNTREMKGNNPFYNRFFGGANPLVLDNNEEAIRDALWKKTDELYKNAARNYLLIKANKIAMIASEEKSNDFTEEAIESYSEKPITFQSLSFHPKEWEERLKKYSNVFSLNKNILTGSAHMNVELLRKYFVDTDGTKVMENTLAYRIDLNASAIAEDGMNIPLYKSYFALNQKDLPSDEKILSDAKQMVDMIIQLKKAPVAEPFTGPALLTPRASCVFFHEIFGHRLEGARLKMEADGNTFKNKIGELVLPSDFSVIFDPTLTSYKGFDLSGNYKYDDEGVKGQRVTVVENGILKSFLMDRTPVGTFSKSNGHGRGVILANTCTRQSNMLIESSHPRSIKELREMLIREAKNTGKEYGYLFDEVSSGFTTMGVYMPNAFNIEPLIVYRVYADGRPDELVRGVNLIGTPLTMFSQIAAAGNDIGIFNGYCGAESGSIPVSCVSPSIFVKMIETQKQAKSSNRTPILERPVMQKEEAIIPTIKSEVDRNKSELKIKGFPPPFFIRYAMLDNETLEMTASGGSISKSVSYHTRDGLPLLLVGSYSANSMGIIGNMPNFPDRVALDNQGIATAVWSALDKRYKQAGIEYESKKAVLEQRKQTGEDIQMAAFKRITPPNLMLTPVQMNMDQSYWGDFIKKSSEVLNKYPGLTYSKVELFNRNTMTYYYDTENGQYAVPIPYYRLKVILSALANNGQELYDEYFFEHSLFEQMPDLKSFMNECEHLAKEFLELKSAPLVTESYNGPVLFEDFAALQTVQHEFFMNRLLIESNQQVNSYGALAMRENGMESMIGKRIISKSLNLVSLSGTEVYNGVKLDGYYPMDFTGVTPDKKMFLIEKGILKTLLNGRTATKAPNSNGHERYNFTSGFPMVMPGNVRLYSDEAIPFSELKQQLIKVAKESNYDYAYIVRRYQLGNRASALYRVSVANGKEELVRGAAFHGLNSRSFNRVIGISKEEFIGNHTALGQITTLIVPKGILFENIEVVRDNSIDR